MRGIESIEPAYDRKYSMYRNQQLNRKKREDLRKQNRNGNERKYEYKNKMRKKQGNF